MLNDAKVSSACSYVRRCRRVRNSQNIATIRDLKVYFCVNSTNKQNKYLTIKVILSKTLFGEIFYTTLDKTKKTIGYSFTKNIFLMLGAKF